LQWICFPEVVDLCRRSSPQLQSQMQESLRSLLVPISVSTESILTCKVFWCFTHAPKKKSPLRICTSRVICGFLMR
jgi:hypothetical protein